jgi:hypothetical protein
MVSKLRAVKKSAEENIYERSKGCSKYWTVLCFILELLTVKAKRSWSDTSFNDFMRMLAWLLPKPNKVPGNTYQAKKLVSPFTMGVERIHAYPNHCILYRENTFKDLDKCSVCSASRYKNNSGYCGGDIQGSGDGNKRKMKGVRNSVASVESPDTTLGISEKRSRIFAMVTWYLLVSDRLRRFFSNPKDVELIQWWDSDKRKKGYEKLLHPADARQWKKFDEQYYLEFGKDPGNVWFGLNAVAMNPFGDRTSTHSTWSVILKMYNLPTWLC